MPMIDTPWCDQHQTYHSSDPCLLVDAVADRTLEVITLAADGEDLRVQLAAAVELLRRSSTMSQLAANLPLAREIDAFLAEYESKQGGQ